MPQSIYAIATMDTKGDELTYVAERLTAANVPVITVDVGTFGPPILPARVSRETVAACHSEGAAAVLGLTDRGQAVAAMGVALRSYLLREQAENRIAGVIGLGGSGGTALISVALQALPIGLPKVLVSTVASGNVAPYVGCSDMVLMYSVVDVAGLNAVSRVILANAAHAIAGMVTHTVLAGAQRPTIGMTMFGVTTPCVDAVRRLLEGRGFDCLVFHATGTGGRAMERLVESGLIRGVLDVTTTEVADEVVGGVFTAGPQRFDAILNAQVPYVMSLGALDMVNFGARTTVPTQFDGRKLHIHNPQVTLMRTTADENRSIARWMATKINRSTAPITLLVPELGVSALDQAGQPFHDPEADSTLFTELEASIEQTPARQLERLPLHINDARFAAAIVTEFQRLWSAAGKAILALAICLCLCAGPANAQPLLPGFHRSPWFDEQVREEWVAPGVRAIANASTHVDASKPTRLVIFATPNGNTIENTLGRALTPGTDWHYDIQHVLAQVRLFRSLSPHENIVLVCTEAEGLSWPAWKKKFADGPKVIHQVVDWARNLAPGNPVRVTLTCHSGGGSFLFGFIDGADAIPDFVECISFLDANYGYSDDSKHAEKFQSWLHGDQRRRLLIIAYDDREITLNGKKVVGPDGGTFRATQRMLKRLREQMVVLDAKVGPFDVHHTINGRLKCYVHPNPQNKILHTVLVGEMNGVLQALTDSEPNQWGTFGGPRAYSKFVQPAPVVPNRPENSPTGRAFMESIAHLDRHQREDAIAKEVLNGNIPDFLRQWQTVAVKEKNRSLTFEVMPDYLAVGSNSNWVRVPMSPLTAQRIADAWDCTLPTPKLVDAIDQQAAVKLKPIPLTEARETVATFVRHHDLIEEQRKGHAQGQLVTGIKKDVVVTNRLAEKDNRVALYGWRQLDGTPIQPLTFVHVNWYVDYSHGARLIKRAANVDNKPRDLRYVMYANDTCGLVSDEGSVKRPSY